MKYEDLLIQRLNVKNNIRNMVKHLHEIDIKIEEIRNDEFVPLKDKEDKNG